MTATHILSSSEIRARLGHPIIDSDGHFEETEPVLLDYIGDYIKKVGGSRSVKELLPQGLPTHGGPRRWITTTPEQRRDENLLMAGNSPNRDARDRATGYLPRLLHERMDELGIDFCILYPTSGRQIARRLPTAEGRQICLRAFNSFCADYYGEFSDRMTPAAVIPMESPQEAVQELDFAVKHLRLKVVVLGGPATRPIPKVQRENPQAAQYATRLDMFGIDSEYDYDLVWAKCVELKVAATFHAVGMGIGYRQSTSNYIYNHIHHFAEAGEALCKAIFLGGVTRRFPTLRFAFLEGGAGWACSLYADLIEQWKASNPKALKQADLEELMTLFRQYGDQRVLGNPHRLREYMARQLDLKGLEQPANPDWYAACNIQRPEDIRDLFIPSFFFGCEAGDPMNAVAFNKKLLPFGAQVGAIFGSDIGHWDVPDMKKVVQEAHELIERDVMSEEDFRRFTFVNPVRLHLEMNPNFFKGTKVEADVAKLVKTGL